jgi:hypothetical protein
MKHIKKKFLYQFKVGDRPLDLDKFEIEEVTGGYSRENLKSRIDQLLYIQTNEDFNIGGFVCKVNGIPIILPIPDLTLIYFNDAQAMLRNLKSTKENLLCKLDFNETLAEPAVNDIYGYFGSMSVFVIMLFTSIESFINHLIPDGFEYRNITKNRTEIYSKYQIQENLNFKTKITKVLKEATGKDFFHSPTQATQHIWNLKNFRDDIVHTKHEENPNKYGKLLKLFLNFNYEQSLDAVAKFMNHYKKDYIEECGCGTNL